MAGPARGEVACVQRDHEHADAVTLSIWGTDEQPLPLAVDELLAQYNKMHAGSNVAGLVEMRAVACIAILEISGGTCITNTHVQTIRERGNLLHSVEAFFTMDWSGNVSQHTFGARPGHPVLHTILRQLQNGKSLAQTLGTISQRLERGISA